MIDLQFIENRGEEGGVDEEGDVEEGAEGRGEDGRGDVQERL